MAKEASKCLFLFFSLFLFTLCISGNLVGFVYDARRDSTSSSITKALSFLKLHEVEVSPSQVRVLVSDHRVLDGVLDSGFCVDLLLDENQVENLRNSKHLAMSWLKTQLMNSPTHTSIKSIIVSSNNVTSSDQNVLPRLLSTLKSIHSILTSFDLKNQVKVSLQFSLSVLENSNREHRRDLHNILSFIKKIGSFVIVEAKIDGELNLNNGFVELVIKKAKSATSAHVPLVLTIKSPPELAKKTWESLLNKPQVSNNLDGLFVELEMSLKVNASNRELLTIHDTIDPPSSSVAIPSADTTPTIIAVPSSNPATNPVTVTPINSSPSPISVLSTSPVTTPTTIPGVQLVTNPVTTFPSPPVGNVPVTTPVTIPVSPPAVTNSPAASGGQSWCVAKSGVTETALQAALDYACGIGEADCSLIQQGASCDIPNTLQNHASFAFNSYYQKNPVSTSCDFGGTATLVSTNPSSGTCVYPSSTSSVSSASTTTTASPSGPAVSSSVSPPYVLNPSSPTSTTGTAYGSDNPPNTSTTTSSISAALDPFIGCTMLVISIVAAKLVSTL
ncbi:X8 domain [Dillenia turbinata]|uniref:X8 domain n=1 Tax=Dillenia turbinata TaxID=194707 RepID=A0AAN8YT58_9MAGN